MGNAVIEGFICTEPNKRSYGDLTVCSCMLAINHFAPAPDGTPRVSFINILTRYDAAEKLAEYKKGFRIQVAGDISMDYRFDENEKPLPSVTVVCMDAKDIIRKDKYI